MAIIRYPAGGWIPPGGKFVWQRADQGRDFITDWNGIIQAPGDFECVNVGSDRPFPSGFGPDYPWIKVLNGDFGGKTFYIGHCSSVVHIGQRGGFGTPVARANQGDPRRIGIPIFGGWVELGEVQPDGSLGPNSPSGHWFDGLLSREKIITIPDPDPNHYNRFPNINVRYDKGRTLNEQAIVKEYDQRRLNARLNANRLHSLMIYCEFLRKRVWIAAHPNWLAHHSNKPSTWDQHHRGWRYQQLSYRARGKRLHVDFQED